MPSACQRERSVYRAHKAGTILLDGKLSEPGWAAAEPAALVNTMTGRAPRYPTRARVLWDDAHLYVGFECEDEQVWAKAGREHDDPIYEDEVVEVFIDADGDGRSYDEVQVSPANVQFDASFVHHRSDLATAKRWSSGTKSAVAIDGTLENDVDRDRSWTAELAIPLRGLSGLTRPPRAGDRWRFNLYRIDMKNPARVWDGSALRAPLRGDFHALDRFAWLELR
jgi:hypothetical protein